MKADFLRWMVIATATCLMLVVLFGCDHDDHHGGFDVDSILAIIYAVGDVVLAIVQSVT